MINSDWKGLKKELSHSKTIQMDTNNPKSLHSKTKVSLKMAPIVLAIISSPIQWRVRFKVKHLGVAMKKLKSLLLQIDKPIALNLCIDLKGVLIRNPKMKAAHTINQSFSQKNLSMTSSSKLSHWGKRGDWWPRQGWRMIQWFHTEMNSPFQLHLYKKLRKCQLLTWGMLSTETWVIPIETLLLQ